MKIHKSIDFHTLLKVSSNTSFGKLQIDQYSRDISDKSMPFLMYKVWLTIQWAIKTQHTLITLYLKYPVGGSTLLKRHCIMLIHITFMGVYCIYVYFYNYDNNVDVYIYVDFSNEIIVFPLCTAKGG